MHFIAKSEAEPFFVKLGIDRNGLVAGSRGAARLKTFDAYYQSRLQRARQVAEALAINQGDFAACQLWAHDLVWGDRSLEEQPPSDWIAYQKWRESQGERRLLRDAPGHLFDPGERDALSNVIEWAIYMGWDALIAAKPNKMVIHLSHDDRITIYARSKPSDLIVRLAALDLKLKQRGL